MEKYLAIKGFVSFEFSITPRNEFKINDREKIVLEDLGKIIDDEIGAVRAQAFIV